MMKNIIIVAAHPDDEVLGCGGAISKLIKQGAKAHVLFIADGISSRGVEKTDSALLQLRYEAGKKAAEILGVISISFENYPDNKLDTVPMLDIVKSIENKIEEIQPDTVFTHHSGDVNIDHRRISEAVIVACRPQNQHPVKNILFFEVPSSTEWQPPGTDSFFNPNWFIDISDELETKLTALKCYEDELRTWPHPRSIKGVSHLAHWRGATIGVDAAEAFYLARKIT